MEWLFWICVAFIAYTYFGYPVVLQVIASFRPRPVRRGDYTPRVTIIIPCYNEEKRISEKLDNTLRLDYPREQMQILVASDASSDGSDDVVRSYAGQGVTLIRLEERQGKHFAQGRALESADGEIVVFTDASIKLADDGIRRIVSNFADPDIGCVSSVDKIIAEEGSTNTEGVYIRYDMLLRRLESRIGSVTGMSGSFYATRRELCADWIPNMSNDFYMPLRAAMAGLRAIVDPEVLGYYRLVRSYRAEFARKVRTMVHGLQVMMHFKHVLNPFRYGLYAFEAFSHKVCRWLVPFAMIGTVAANIALVDSSVFYRVTMIGQVLLYLAAAVGYHFKGTRQFTLVRVSYFFVMVNASILVAWYRYILGEHYVSWEPSQR